MAVAVVAVEDARVRVQDVKSFRTKGFCETEAGGDGAMAVVGRVISPSSPMPFMLFVSSSKPRGLVEYALWKSLSESSVPAGVRGCWTGEGISELGGGEEENLSTLLEGTMKANLVRGVSGDGRSIRCGLIGGWVRRAGRFGRVGRTVVTNVAS